MLALLDDLKSFADRKLLKIKEKKTTVMKFNLSSSYDFPPKLYIEGFENNLEAISETITLVKKKIFKHYLKGTNFENPNVKTDL